MEVIKTEGGFRKVAESCPYHCNNGKVFVFGQGLVNCPHCSGILGFEETTENVDVNNIFSVLKIPKEYQKCDGLTVKETIAAIPNEMYKYNVDTTQYCRVLTELSDALDWGSLYKVSLLIRELPVASIDLNSIVYGLMLQAVKTGIGVLPYISLTWLTTLRYNKDLESSRFKNTYLQRYNVDGITGMTTSLMLRCKYAMSVDYYDYTLAPLVFVDISTLATANELCVLQELMSERARRDLPTYVTINPRVGSMNLDNLIDGLFNNMVTTKTRRMDKLVPVDYYEAGKMKTMGDVESLLASITRDNTGVVGNIEGYRRTTGNNILNN